LFRSANHEDTKAPRNAKKNSEITVYESREISQRRPVPYGRIRPFEIRNNRDYEPEAEGIVLGFRSLNVLFVFL